MTSTNKYDKHIIRSPFYEMSEEFGGVTAFKQTAEDDSGVMFEHFSITDPTWGIDKVRVNDMHELLCFIGGNPENILDLGAEISFCIGDKFEEHTIKNPTVVSIPPGLKTGYISVRKFNKPFSILRIVNSPEYQAKLEAEAGEDDFHKKRLLEGSDVLKHGNRYWMNFFSGPLYIDYEPGWTGTSIWAHHDEYGCGISLGYHCVVTPYDARMSHAHNNHENLCFLSGDPLNPRELGAKGKVALGNEGEVQYFNEPTIISIPPGLKHCPMLIDDIQKPVLFLEVSVTKEFKGKPEDV